MTTKKKKKKSSRKVNNFTRVHSEHTLALQITVKWYYYNLELLVQSPTFPKLTSKNPPLCTIEEGKILFSH